MSEHVPAWKRFQIKKSEEGNQIDDELDSLIVSTHLSNGSLSKKEKRRIIRGGNADSKSTGNKVAKKSKDRKREKLAKEDRLKKKETVLKDQLRYLIDFYTLKLEVELPEAVKELPSVKENVSIISPSEELADKNVVRDVWKFSKQKQNWLIKHFVITDEIPSAFNPLLVRYFQDLQGGSKAQLQESCLDVIEKQNKYLEQQKEEMAKIVLGEATEASKDQEKQSADDESKDKDVKTEMSKKSDESEEDTANKINEILPPSQELLERVRSMLDTWGVKYELNS
ncbi:RNA-binding ribosome assembly factor RBP95 [Kluyveromyces lactis]|uniref:KLLA0A11066p n=1 Tax=Kluyveromyces lactis (strain ATCC 8585 / CBS 2359 / DSM 70799 / NBRC 1267 / NRRL Y-1140 / WM37) TaxID=284590 RepID=Q6CX57_KLULA|nr:uncharacterized protein KLLA0_A11066g [Kluyveromyces lactis]CAH03070.1 KLLA0A11066p [Kluyveromyces lactis]|eukprot:XP_451482.1 uncharacterized protein KLLA0_A11066g [Kluyveromyces lactis]